jgi:hypothetical protein
MNFTQYNKINSAPPPSKGCNDRYLRNYDSRNFQSSNCMYQPQVPLPPPRQQLHQISPVIHQAPPVMSYAYNSPNLSSTSCTDQCFSSPISTAASSNDDFDIEYFQCSPPLAKSKGSPSPFRPILESMRQFTPAPHKPSHGIGDAINHQTYICSHNDESDCCDENGSCESDDMVNKSYKSFTKIVSIPNGVKIITEIKKEDNCGKADCIECRKKAHSDDHWMNKQIEVTLSEGNLNDGDDDGGNILTEI